MNLDFEVKCMQIIEMIRKYQDAECNGYCSRCSCGNICTIIDLQMSALRVAIELYFEKVGDNDDD